MSAAGQHQSAQPAQPGQPARIVKRADVNAGLARPVAPDPMHARDVADLAPALPARHVTKEARLVPGMPGTAAVEVRCSCGEWTRIELRLGDGRTEEEKK
jgi:hypothetical protein